jgi:hypothetical protein
MRKKFFVIGLQDGNAIKTRLKEWWRSNVGPTSKISHELYFCLLSDGWKSAVVGNEVLLISPDANSGEVEEQRLTIHDEQNEDVQIPVAINQTDGFQAVSEIFSRFIDSYNGLKEHHVLRNQKDITGQLGEWVASVLYNASIAANGINQVWDLVDALGIKYQVKSHAKSPTTAARWTKIDYPGDAPINFIIIVVFDPNYRLQELYKIPFHETLRLRTGSFILNWSQVNEYKVENLSTFLMENGLGFIANV